MATLLTLLSDHPTALVVPALPGLKGENIGGGGKLIISSFCFV
jgi:hypothetical protein